MIRAAILAGLLAASAAPALAAGDPAAVAAVEAFLRDDEKAMLAAVLADKAAADEFNADVKLAAGDAKVMKLVLTKWRGRIVAYAEADARIATPDLEGTYKNSSSMMKPQTRAYLLRRLKTMNEGDRNSLIEYLSAVDTALAENGGKLTWYTKKVVSGIFDKYREDLALYLPVPLAKDAKTGAPAASAALADLRKAAERPAAEPDPVIVKKPAVKDPVAKDPVVKNPPAGKKPSTPVSDGKQTVVVSTSTAALDQAKDAARAEERAGEKFDGSNGTAGGGAVAGAPGAGLPPLGSPAKDGKPSLTAEVPSPSDADENFMADLKKMKTGKAPTKFYERLPAIAGGVLGGLLGGLIGFLLGGPVGLVIGAVVGAGGGALAGHLIGRKLFK